MFQSLSTQLARIQYRGYRYNDSWTQVTILGMVCFCSVGMASALAGLGAGGTQDPQLVDKASSATYACFAVMGLFAGSINNVLGPRLTLCLGTTGYSLYVGGLWAFQLHGTQWFLILGGAVMGITASLLWAAQGCVMMSYPLEKDKGRAFSLFWAIFQMGNLIGSTIALGIQARSQLPGVSTGIYLVFVIIMLCSLPICWLLLPPHLVVRSDGSVVELKDSLGPREELHYLLKLFKDRRMLLLLPMFFASNYFYAYQGAIVTYMFNGRTRALSAVMQALAGIAGALIIGLIFDRLPLTRRRRSLVGCLSVGILLAGVWGGGLALQVQFTRDTVHTPWDWSQGASAGPLILIAVYWASDASFQGLAYYTMACMTNEPFLLARFAGLYKGVQSAGAAVSFGMDAVKTPYLTEHLVSWIMMMISLPPCAYVLWKAPDTNYEVQEDKPGEVIDRAGQKADIDVPAVAELEGAQLK